MTSTLTISQLTKRFGPVEALGDVSLTVNAGQRVALLGHNGAGKSTMMKIILGLIAADQGAVSVCGARPGSTEARAQVAYLPENAAFHPALTGEEQLRHYLTLRGESPRLAVGLLEKVGLGHAARRRIGTYSKGMRQRVGLAQALIGHPRLLVLDEPTSGLDPVTAYSIDQLIVETRDRLQVTSVVVSHDVSSVFRVADRIAFLHQGEVVFLGTPTEFRESRNDAIREIVEKGRAEQFLSGTY